MLIVTLANSLDALHTLPLFHCTSLAWRPIPLARSPIFLTNKRRRFHAMKRSSHEARQRLRRSPEAPAADVATAVQGLLQEFAHVLPKLVVFDLDYTLWPCYCEMFEPHNPPVGLYPDVPAILDGLEQAGVEMALASRTPTPHVAAAWLDQLRLRSRFSSIQLIPARDGYDQHTAQKDTQHLPAILRETGHAYSAMLFFDDEHNNIRKVSRLGVASILVDGLSGVCLHSFERGLRAYAKAQGTAPVSS